jgi:endonuclease/exonuclease/phosphatase family metal-dependent hydrolase
MFVLGLWGIVMDVKLLTLNLFLRPPGIKTNYSDYKDLRTNVFLEDYLDSFDLICLQEVFDPLSDRKQKILKTAESRGFFSKTSSSPRWSKGHFIDSGLLILSKFPILESDEIVYTDGKGVDGLCAKGGLYIKVCISNKFVHIFTTHLQAAYFTEDFNTFLQYRIIKKKQLIELKAFVDGKTRNCKDVVFVAGDFNVDGRENMKKQMFEVRDI